VYAINEYDPLAFDAVLVRERTAICLDGDETVRAIPLDKVSHVEADAAAMLTGPELPDTFYGGGEYGFVDLDEYPQLQQHLDELEAEEY